MRPYDQPAVATLRRSEEPTDSLRPACYSGASAGCLKARRRSSAASCPAKLPASTTATWTGRPGPAHAGKSIPIAH
jgi:hypothetical protein